MNGPSHLSLPETFLPGGARRPASGAHVIVVGNEKGGAGKSTVAIHIAIALMRMGQRVTAIDLDLRQASFTRHLENRARWAAKRGIDLPIPDRASLRTSLSRNIDQAEADEKTIWARELAALSAKSDFIVIDAPGHDTHYARLAHASADTIITPVNDSFVDFDLLAEVDPDTFEVGRPSLYSEMVWNCRKQRALADKRSIDWVVMRNRVSTLDARNTRRVADGLKKLSERVGFRIAPGFSERVIYRELFPVGLTLIDLTESGSAVPFTMSHVAARQELRDLLIVLRLPALAGKPFPF